MLMNGNWQESRTGIVSLSGHSTKFFTVFIHWLHTKVIMLEEIQANKFFSLIDLYVLGDRLGAPAFQNSSMDAICRHCECPNGESWWTAPDLTVIKYAYENTSHESPLRQFFVDAYAYGILPSLGSWFSHDEVEFYPERFIVQLSRACCEGAKPCPFHNEGCVYHTHPDGVKCYDGVGAPKP